MHRIMGLRLFPSLFLFVLSVCISLSAWAGPDKFIRELLETKFGQKFVSELGGTTLSASVTAKLYEAAGVSTEIRELNTALKYAMDADKISPTKLELLFGDSRELTKLKEVYESAKGIAEQ